jgi:hypothetical protein
LINGPQPDRRIFRDIGIPDEMPIHPAQRPSVLWIKKSGLPSAAAALRVAATVATIVAAVVGVVMMFR